MSAKNSLLEFLQKRVLKGIFISYKEWVSNQKGHSSTFNMKYNNELFSFQINFDSQEDFKKHVAFLEKEITFFLATIVYDQFNKSLTLDHPEIKLGLVCKLKKIEQNYLVINITDFNYDAVPPETIKRK